jgi:hypothetical protein
MNAQEIARAITSIAFMKQTQEQKSAEMASKEAEELVELVLEQASSLGKKYETSSMVVFQQILAQAQIGMGKGAKGDKAVADAAAGVKATLIKALELEKKYS